MTDNPKSSIKYTYSLQAANVFYLDELNDFQVILLSLYDLGKQVLSSKTSPKSVN